MPSRGSLNISSKVKVTTRSSGKFLVHPTKVEMYLSWNYLSYCLILQLSPYPSTKRATIAILLYTTPLFSFHIEVHAFGVAPRLFRLFESASQIIARISSPSLTSG